LLKAPKTFESILLNMELFSSFLLPGDKTVALIFVSIGIELDRFFEVITGD
jgi:hypothetical protein